MGGSAFTSGARALHTPRMPPAVYHHVRDECHAKLQHFFEYVTTPIEAPGKTDYGDVDILVACPRDAMSRREAFADDLGAVQLIAQRGNPVINLALPWPDLPTAGETLADLEDAHPQAHLQTEASRYIQVDVHICDNKQSWEWEAFHEAHGDLWNMLGSTIRKFGLTVNNEGFFLRVEDIERHNRKQSMIFLSSNPTEVLTFLDLDVERWWQPFNSVDDLFEYAASCRFFWVGEEPDAAKLKHNDRQRMSKRKVFRQWIEDFIPRCREQNRFLGTHMTRETTTAEACQQFMVQTEYENKLDSWHREHLKHEAVQIIKSHEPMIRCLTPSQRGQVVRTLKSIILDGDSSLGPSPDAPFSNEKGFYDLECVQRFVEQNWLSLSSTPHG